MQEPVTGVAAIKATIQHMGLGGATVDLACGSVDAQPVAGGTYTFQLCTVILPQRFPPLWRACSVVQFLQSTEALYVCESLL